ncbi:AI-2E family transporter, partial [Streptomyces albidoflavus]
SVRACAEAAGPVDVLVNNAGESAPAPEAPAPAPSGDEAKADQGAGQPAAGPGEDPPPAEK